MCIFAPSKSNGITHPEEVDTIEIQQNIRKITARTPLQPIN